MAIRTRKADIYYFWEHKLEKMGYRKTIAVAVSKIISDKSEWILEQLPHRLPAYLRYRNNEAMNGKPFSS